jgi:hypothetical protein
MRLSTYARPQMKHLGIKEDGTVDANYGLRNLVLTVTGIDVISYNLVGPIYESGDYQPVVTGKAKIGESTEDAIRREVFEEIGCSNVTIIPFPRAPGFPKWTFAVAIRGRYTPPLQPIVDTRRDDYNRRVMVAVLQPPLEVIMKPPPNTEQIVGLSFTPLTPKPIV